LSVPLELTEGRTYRFLLGMSVYNLGVSLMWTSYSAILLPILVQNTTSESSKGRWLGVISLTSVAVGIFTAIVSGILSDHSQSKWGRRTPYIVSGMILAVGSISLLSYLPLSLPFVFAGFFFIQLFGNLSEGSYRPLLADLIPERQRGLESGLQGVFNILGAAVGFLAITALVSAGNLRLAMIAIALTLLATTIFNTIVIRDEDRPLPGTQPIRFTRVLAETYHADQHVPGFFWFVFANFLMYMGVTSFASFGIYYFQTILHIPDPVQAMGVSGMVGILATIIAALAAGTLSDHIGRRSLIILAGVLAGSVVLFFPFLNGFSSFLFLAAIYGAANGIIYSVNQAMAGDLVPVTEAGKYMAYSNLSVGVASAVAPLVFGLVFNSTGAPTQTSFIYFFSLAAFFYFSSSLVFWRRVPARQAA
jgi:MFS family permease